MFLTSVETTDFLSVKDTLKIAIDRKITVLLGSNDHGKSNILRALQHLNNDQPITADEANWDAAAPPTIKYTFSLTKEEQRDWAEIVVKELSATSPAEGDASTDSGEAKTVSVRSPIPTTQLKLTLSGIGTQLQLEEAHINPLSEPVTAFLAKYKPRVEMFKNLGGSLQDSVSSSELVKDDFEFMQGLFFYAGVDPMNCGDLFTQNDTTTRALDNASKQLDTNLRRLWGQGTELHFLLRHHGSAIEFLADDPAVVKRVARMSKRSDGVTQFFRISMVLHARRMKNPANSYIYLFDEPGVFLHPQGQKDLLQVLEQLGEQSQIIYTTHSLFMLNQNFPERHRLVYKDKEGTKIDQKPYQANWKLATDALGVFLTSNILFSSKVLLVEGDSDPIYVYELIRQLNQLGQIDADSNALGIFSFSDYKNLRFLLQVFTKEGQNNKVLVLVDGDSQGNITLEKVKPLCERLGAGTYSLDKGKSVEDYCLLKDKLLEAVVSTMQVALKAEGITIPATLQSDLTDSWNANINAQQKESAGRWFKRFSKSLLGDEASKVGLARNYVLLAREVKDIAPKQEDLLHAKSLCQEIISRLELPSIRAKETITVPVQP